MVVAAPRMAAGGASGEATPWGPSSGKDRERCGAGPLGEEGAGCIAALAMPYATVDCAVGWESRTMGGPEGGVWRVT